MSRPRQFNPETVINAAMNQFWETGYLGTKLPDLLRAMDMSRGSFYKAFDSKKNVFLGALAHYNVLYVEPALLELENLPPNQGIDHIQSFFGGIVNGQSPVDPRGCLLCNTLASSAIHDEEIAHVVNGMVDRLTAAFLMALNSDQSVEMDTEQKEAEALRVTLTYIGLRVYARHGEQNQTSQLLRKIKFV